VALAQVSVSVSGVPRVQVRVVTTVAKQPKSKPKSTTLT